MFIPVKWIICHITNNGSISVVGGIFIERKPVFGSAVQNLSYYWKWQPIIAFVSPQNSTSSVVDNTKSGKTGKLPKHQAQYPRSFDPSFDGNFFLGCWNGSLFFPCLYYVDLNSENPNSVGLSYMSLKYKYVLSLKLPQCALCGTTGMGVGI